MKIKIEQLSSKEQKIAKNNNPYMVCGIKAGGKWYNGMMWKDDIEKFNQLNEGMEIHVVHFTEDYQGKTYDKFRFPKPIDLLEERVTALENAVMGNVKKEEKPAETAATEQPSPSVNSTEEVPPETIENKDNEPSDLPF